MSYPVTLHWQTTAPGRIAAGPYQSYTACDQAVPCSQAFWGWTLARRLQHTHGAHRFTLCPDCAAIQALQGTDYHGITAHALAMLEGAGFSPELVEAAL